VPAAADDRLTNQRRRTRKDLLEAAARLLRQGAASPGMEEVAEAALVSRATAYRYFPSVEALLVEASIDTAVPDPREVFAGDPSTDPAERVDRAEAALHEMTFGNEAQLRLMLVHAIQQALKGGGTAMPIRQNRRIPLIEAALAPARDRFTNASYQKLCAALAVLFGPEAMVVFRDVLQADAEQAREVKSWAVRALVRAALAESEGA
jgi:AcrR family transcriptional regulator